MRQGNKAHKHFFSERFRRVQSRISLQSLLIRVRKIGEVSGANDEKDEIRKSRKRQRDSFVGSTRKILLVQDSSRNKIKR